MRIINPYISIMMLVFPVFLGCDTETNVDPNFENYFLKYYGGEGSQIGVDMAVLDDGFVLVGTSRPNDNASSMFIVRTDILGNETWSLLLGGNASEANAVAVDESGNFVMAGTSTLSSTDKDILLIRVSSDGNVMDSLSLGVVDEIESANEVTLTSEGDIIVVGSTTNVNTAKLGYNPNTDFEDIYSVRLDASFMPFSEADWRRVNGFPGIDRGTDILQKDDGSFLIFGTTDRPPSSSQKDGFNMFLYPAGSDGQATSATQLQLFGTLENENGVQMVKTADQGFAMIGTSNNGSENDMFIVRVRSNNDFLSSGLLNSGRNLSASSIIESKGGGFFVLGRELINNAGNLLLGKTTISGALLWQQSFGGVDNDLAGEVKEMADGSIVFVGTIELESQSKICLIKTNGSGLLRP